MRGLIAIALVAVPVAAGAQTAAPSAVPAAAPVDPVRRDAARALIDQIMPPSTRADLMRTMLAGVTANVRNGMEQNPQFKAAIDGDPRVRPIFERFIDRQMKQSSDMLIAAMPAMADAMTSAYARRFDLAQLRELSAFFATPTGRAYAAASTTIMSDPDIAAWQRSLMQRSMSTVQADVGDLVKEIAALPPKGTKQ